jgi:hypothetical protein
VPPVPMILPAARRGLPGAVRVRGRLPLILAAAAGMVVALPGCHSDQNVSRAYECSKGREYQESSPACHSGHTSHAPGVARVQATPPG